MSSKLRNALALFAVMLSWGHAGLADFVVPSFRGDADTTYQQWEVFTSPTGPNAPDVALSNPNGTPDVVETTGTSFVTSGGNIYSFAAATSFDVTIPDYGYGSGYETNVVVQFRIQGTDLDAASVFFNGIAPDSYSIVYEEALGGFGGVLRDWEFVWSGLPSSLAENLLTFSASESSMSLDRLAVDTQSVPVPESGSILMVAAASVVGAGVWSRRRKASV